MARVYSTKFLEAQGLVGLTTYTVPAGYLAVVRSIDIVIDPTISTGSVQFLGAVNQKIIEALLSLSNPVNIHWQGRQVFNPGDAFAFSSSAGADCTASGYLLTLP